jgi:RTX calcium-binding nonapeptide repeat (4 copies)/Bacterial Ig-like domain
VATVVTILGTAPAMASDVSVGSNGELSFQAAVNVANALTISGDGPVTVMDTADPVNAGTGCTAIDASTASCEGVSKITVNARDGNDVVTILSGGFISAVNGQDGDDTLNGGPGVDLLRGRAGNDTLTGNDGNDVLTGDAGNDLMSGGSGADRADYATSSGATVDLRNTAAQDTGDGMDTLTGIENINGSTTGPDVLTGDAAPNTFIGSGGDDIFHIEGDGSDRDFVNCGAGSDQVFPDRSDTVRGVCETIDDGLPVDTTITDGPSGETNNPTWKFTADEPWARFECTVVDSGGDLSTATWDPCTSPKGLAPLSDGSSGVFAVRAVDDQAPDATPETRPFTIDTTPPDDTRIESGPSGNAATTDPTPTFFFSSLDPETVGFLCRFDNQSFFVCSSPLTADPLTDGTHTFEVAATDAVGNFDQTPASVSFRVDTSGPGPGPGPGDGPVPSPQSPPVQQAKIIIGSLVLISGNTVRMSRTGRVRISLTCAGAVKCAGRLSITTAEPVSKRDRKLVTLGAKRFTIGANKTRKVNVRFSKPRIRLARKLKRFKAKAVIREIDVRGNPRISSRIFTLRAR